MGYDGIKFNDSTVGVLGSQGNMPTNVAFNPSQIKTKSQLTEIWNKAHEVKTKQEESYFGKLNTKKYVK